MDQKEIIAQLIKIGKGGYVGQEDRETLKHAIQQRGGTNRYGLTDDKDKTDRPDNKLRQSDRAKED